MEHPLADPGPPPWAAHLAAGLDASQVDLLGHGSLVRAWTRQWVEDPERPTLWDDQRGWRTAGQLERSSRLAAARLHRAGLRPGDRVLLSATASTALVEAYVGALRLGAAVVPLNTAYREREVTHIALDAAPRAAVVDDPERAAWIRGAAGDVIVVGPEVDLPEGPVPDLDAAGPDDPALVCYTSGTTGAPKGALLRHGNLLASAEGLRLAWRWTEHDRLVLALPLFHLHGLGVGLHGTLLAGASAVLLPRFEVDTVLDASLRHQATLFFGVPTMYSRLAASTRLGELGRLRLCVSGSAPLSPTVFERVAVGSGQQVLERYGMTETLMNVSNPYDGQRRPGTVGLPLPAVEVRLAPHPRGEILVKGPNVFSGYWRSEAATAAAFDDGWFRTGDVGELDEAGYLRIVGRSRELIITGGFNVYPREVEEVLLAHPGVADAAVVGTPSEEWGEVVTAYVVAGHPRPRTDEVLELAAERLAPFKRPRVLRFVDSLPRNALGKVQRDELTRD
ncbi:MAG TPA: AMP-binding protein [Acidimicrobiales bacterium]